MSDAPATGVRSAKEADVTNALAHRTFRLEGPEGLGAEPRPEMIGPILTNLHGSLLDAVRMGFLHSSRPHGRIPSILKAAADVRYLGHDGDGDGATLLHFRVPTFGDVAPDLFRQKRLWEDDPQQEETAFELFGAALRDVAQRQENSSRYDPGMLRRIRTYRNLLAHGIDCVAMPDTAPARRGHIDAAVVSAAAELIAVTPAARRVRVTGRLDLMGASQSVLKLEVRPGEVVTALWEGQQSIEHLREFFNQDIVLEGTGVFRPSGTLLRIDADALAPAGPHDDFFRTLPSAEGRRDYRQMARLKSGERSVYAQLRGFLPPEESDEEFDAALAELR